MTYAWFILLWLGMQGAAMAQITCKVGGEIVPCAEAWPHHKAAEQPAPAQQPLTDAEIRDQWNAITEKLNRLYDEHLHPFPCAPNCKFEVRANWQTFRDKEITGSAVPCKDGQFLYVDKFDKLYCAHASVRHELYLNGQKLGTLEGTE